MLILNIKQKKLIVLCLFSYLHCSNIPNTENRNSDQPNQIIDIENTIQNPERFTKLIEILKSKDCNSFKALLGNSFYFSLGEASIVFFFYKDKEYREHSINTDVCDLIFDDQKLEKAIIDLTEFKYKTYSPHYIVNNSKYLDFGKDVGTNSEYMVNLYFQNIKLETFESHENTWFSFKCRNRDYLNCYLESFNTNLIYSTK
ncbi:hypothetical protein JWG41_02925 [Leptospira sp. 201903075]|uniref:hypothetical protein n=1 Tax=Leptospira chreensis TaxID=2810035 RepID=UPI001962CA02|nr:hypothetical protein [Leptospira chreensis]MBM9589383.1 hypothetical protein [Leptospira chreensis]